MLEKELETKFVLKVKSLGGMAEKYVSVNRRSVPDRLVTLPGGRIIFAEIKRPGGKVTDAQARDHARRRALGCKVMIIDCLERIDAFPKEI